MPHRTQPQTSHTMTARARRLRRQATVPERLLWGVLRGRRLGGLKFRRQAPVGPYVADFLCEAAKLVVEVDGESHGGRVAADAARTAHLASRGLTVVRVSNDDVLANLDEVAAYLLRVARELIDAREGEPSPRPSPGGRGS